MKGQSKNSCIMRSSSVLGRPGSLRAGARRSSNRRQSSPKRLANAIAGHAKRGRLRWSNKAWKAKDLIRVGRPRKIPGARICPTYRRARRAEVAMVAATKSSTMAASAATRVRVGCKQAAGQRGGHQDSHNPSHGLFLSPAAVLRHKFWRSGLFRRTPIEARNE